MAGHRFFIYGSCVSRDTFDVLAARGHTLARYVARQSLASAGLPSTRSLPGIDALTSRFQRRMLSGDVVGDLPHHLTRIEEDPPRVLLWDLTDERLGLHAWPDGSLTTDTVEARTMGRGAPEAGFRHVAFGSDEHFELWCTGLDRLEHALERSAIDRVLLLDVPWARQTTSGADAPRSFDMPPSDANRLFRRYVARAAERSWVETIGVDHVSADIRHRWGAAPFHYSDDTYTRVADLIEVRLARVRAGRARTWVVSDDRARRARRQSFGRGLDPRADDASSAQAVLDGRATVHGSVEVDASAILDGSVPLPESSSWRAAWHALSWTDPLRRLGARGYAHCGRHHLRLVSAWLVSAPAESDRTAWAPAVTARRTLALVAAAGLHGATPWLVEALDLHGSSLLTSRSAPPEAQARELSALVAAAAVLGTTAWLRDVADELLPDLLDRTVAGDGGPISGSTRRHAAMLAAVAEIATRLEIARNPVDDALADRIDSMAQYVAHSTGPHGRLVPFGDTGDRRPDAVAHPAIQFVRSRGADGSPPAQLRADFPTSGFVFWRTAWKHDATYMSMRTHDAVRRDDTTHDDAGSVTLTIGTTTYLRDLGWPRADGRSRGGYRAPDAHNVVVVDGEAFSDVPGRHQKSSPGEARCHRRSAQGTSWRRSAQLSPTGLLVVVDELHGSDRPWRQRWHLPAGARVTTDDAACSARISAPESAPVLTVRWTGPAGTACRVVPGPSREGAPVLEVMAPSAGVLITTFTQATTGPTVTHGPDGVCVVVDGEPAPLRLRLGPGRAEPPVDGRWLLEDVGTLRSVCVRTAAVRWSDQGPRILLVGDGTPASVTEVDARSGEVLRSTTDSRHRTGAALLPTADGSWLGSTRSPDDGAIWRFGEHGFHEIHRGVAGQKMVRRLAHDVDGAVLIGTYPEARVLRMMPGEPLQDLGRASADAVYAWSIAAEAGGWWVGTGPGARLVHIDRTTGARGDLALPASIAVPGSFAVEMSVTDESVLCFTGLDPSGPVHGSVVDRATGTARPFAGGLGMRLPSFVADNPMTLLALRDEGLCAVSDTSVQPVAGGPSPDVAAATSVLSAAPDGCSAVGATIDGAVWWWNGSSTRVHRPSLPLADLAVNMLGALPDGRVLVGAFLGPGVLGVVGAEDDAVRPVPGPRQADVAVPGGDGVLIACYPGLRLETAPSDLASRRTLAHIGRASGLADRPTAMAVGPTLIAVGAVAPYGHPGGSLVVLDRAGTLIDVTTPVPHHSVTALVAGSRAVFGGTSVHGGRGSAPAPGEASLFRYLPGAGVTWAHPVPTGGRAVLGLALADDDDSLAVLTDRGLLLLVTADGELIASTRVGAARDSRWGLGAGLFRRHCDPAVYGYSGGCLFAADPDLGEIRVLVPRGVRHAVAAEDGTLYVSDGRRISRLRRPTTN